MAKIVIEISEDMLKEQPVLAWAQLTPMQFRIARMAAKGMGPQKIANELGFVRNTIQNNLRKILRTLGYKSRRQFARTMQAELTGYPKWTPASRIERK